jgi:hypothetical protein
MKKTWAEKISKKGILKSNLDLHDTMQVKFCKRFREGLQDWLDEGCIAMGNLLAILKNALDDVHTKETGRAKIIDLINSVSKIGDVLEESTALRAILNDTWEVKKEEKRGKGKKEEEAQ